ncbi:hypothetical protein GCM10011344_01490 [Dokdonia pacifica]|uniref:Selenophosphate synthetase n=1 Tax=Dokdonia pacifica TaxID=1627892 RepID=A0A238Z8L4_9FLAO|nr:hypothetical protein [Dokdonia pacifica]GGG04832.1 hypothetical protein GCM10011344_01490 [Dokdonia pacifica]SNR79298.1 hypothetical protein SAMN06265376_1039 [Dokdonia pacifica]
MKTIYLIACIAFLSLSCKNETPQQKESELPEVNAENQTEKKELTEAEKIANANGFGNWDAVSQIDFTFNVDRQGQNVAKRSWSWKPKTNDVTMTLGEQVIAYNRASMDSVPPGTDEGFINDKFWLLAPYQLVWDEGTSITVQDTATAPISQKKTKKLTILYGNEGGYTPGDAYDFYYDADDYIIDEWVFRKSNAPEPSMMTTFSDYQKFEGLNISTSHTDKVGDLKLYFTDIKVVK